MTPTLAYVLRQPTRFTAFVAAFIAIFVTTPVLTHMAGLQPLLIATASVVTSSALYVWLLVRTSIAFDDGKDHRTSEPLWWATMAAASLAAVAATPIFILSETIPAQLELPLWATIPVSGLIFVLTTGFTIRSISKPRRRLPAHRPPPALRPSRTTLLLLAVTALTALTVYTLWKRRRTN